MSFDNENLTSKKFYLKGPGGNKDHIATTRVVTAGISGSKLFVVQMDFQTAVLHVFDLSHFTDEDREPTISQDEFYALREEVRDVRKEQARAALSAEGKRGPGRPSNAEREALAAGR